MYFHIFFQIENVRFHGYDKLCHCQLKGGEDTATTKKSCDDAIRIREEPRILCDRAEVFHEKDSWKKSWFHGNFLPFLQVNLAEDLFDEAVNDYRRALELDENFQRAKEGNDFT